MTEPTESFSEMLFVRSKMLVSMLIRSVEFTLLVNPALMLSIICCFSNADSSEVARAHNAVNMRTAAKMCLVMDCMDVIRYDANIAIFIWDCASFVKKCNIPVW